MADYTTVQGATETIREQFTDDNGDPIDVSTNDELRFYLRTEEPPDGSILVNKAASFDSVEGDGTGTDGWVTVTLDPADTNVQAGTHIGHFYYEATGGSPAYYEPDEDADEYITVKVISSLSTVSAGTVDAGDFTGTVDAVGNDIINLGILNFDDVTNASPSEGDMWREGDQFYLEPDGNGQEAFPGSGGSGGSAVEIQNGGTSLTSDVTVIDFQDGVDATEPTADEIDVVLDASVISPGDLGFDPATQSELDSQTHPLGDLEQSGATDGQVVAYDSGSGSYQPTSVGGGSVDIYGESGAVTIGAAIVRFLDESDVLDVDVGNPAPGEANVTYRVQDGSIGTVHLSFDPATQAELDSHTATTDAHRSDSNIRSVVEGTTDVADLVGSLGSADQVPLTDGSAVTWGDVDLATLADALDKDALNGAVGADGQVWTSTGSGAQWENAPSGGSGLLDATTTTITSTSYTTADGERLWVDTGTAGGNVTISLPSPADGARIEVGVRDATHDVILSTPSGSIIGTASTITNQSTVLLGSDGTDYMAR